jgi:hypothetical protein
VVEKEGSGVVLMLCWYSLRRETRDDNPRDGGTGDVDSITVITGTADEGAVGKEGGPALSGRIVVRLDVGGRCGGGG